MFSQVAITLINPPGASSVSSVVGYCILIIFFSNNTVVTHIAFDPLMGGLSSGSIIIKPASAFLCEGSKIILQCLNTPPLGSFKKKFLHFLSLKSFDDASLGDLKFKS